MRDYDKLTFARMALQGHQMAVKCLILKGPTMQKEATSTIEKIMFGTLFCEVGTP